MPTHTHPQHMNGGFDFEENSFRIPCLEIPLSATDSKSISNPRPYLHPHSFSCRRRSEDTPAAGGAAGPQEPPRAGGPTQGRKTGPSLSPRVWGCLRPRSYDLFPFSGHFKAPKMWVQSLPLRRQGACPAHAWPLRLVFLCRLVRLRSNPIWTEFPQAGAAAKTRSHNSNQIKPNSPGFAVTQ